MRTDWTALPEKVKAGIAERAGGTHVIPASAGDHAEIAATVAGVDGKVFVKAASSDLGVRSLRYELLVSRAVDRPYSPAVVWDFDTDGWLAVGFEHLDGPQADLSPGSRHLDLLAEILEDLGRTPVRGSTWFTPASRFGFARPEMNGKMLVHTDLNPANLIVTAGGLRVVDWAYATKAAPWVELAVLAHWLVGSGHSPEQADKWLAQFPAWGTISPDAVDDVAVWNAAKWSDKARRSAEKWVHDLATWTGEWAAYRRGR